MHRQAGDLAASTSAAPRRDAGANRPQGRPDASVYNAFAAGRSTDALFTFMAAAFVIYLGLTALSDLGLRALERRYSRGVQRA